MLARLLPWASASGAQSRDEQAEVLRAFTIYNAWRQHNNLTSVELSASSSFANTLQSARNHLSSYSAAHRAADDERVASRSIESGKTWFAKQSGGLFFYEFTENEVAEIQNRLNELRELITSSTELKDAHKIRLLRRLEQLQTELNKKMSDLDRFWGLIGDAGVAIRKFGKDTKRVAAMLAAIKTITWIVWKAQLMAHQLPPDTHHPLLLPPQEHKTKANPSKTLEV
jgi:hypothetical protein